MLGKTCLMGDLIYDNETAVYYTPHLTLSFHHKMQTRSLRTTNLSPGRPARPNCGFKLLKPAKNKITCCDFTSFSKQISKDSYNISVSCLCICFIFKRGTIFSDMDAGIRRYLGFQGVEKQD